MLFRSHPTSRGVALLGDKVYFAAGHAVLVALDAKTGKAVWETTVADNKSGYYMSLAPLVADGKAMIGTSGGERGIRGYVGAYDAQTGKDAWRTYTVPAPGEPGSETWPQGDQWKTGGGSVWVTGNYDIETNIAYWGTGNGGPWMGDQRPGDNLYTSSTIALNVSNGKIVGHFQYHPNDSWDWDEVSPPILVDYKRNGKNIKGLIDFARDGYMWFLERAGEKINYVQGQAFVKQNVFLSLDPKTGRPNVDPARQPGTGKKTAFCPSLWGGKDWPPAAYNPKTRLLYVPAHENLCSTLVGEAKIAPYDPGKRYVGTNAAATRVFPREGADHIGELQAWNLDTGKRVWTYNYPDMNINWGPVLTTGGGMVFCGDTLFACGCGRLFEGTPAQMHAALAKLAKLPGDTRVYCGHEYTVSNIKFARAVEADNASLKKWEQDAAALRAKDQPTLPSTIADELRANPFMRCEIPAVAAAASRHAGKPLTDAVSVLGALREWKNNF